MNEVVQYHNDLNKITLPHFNELEQNLLCIILTKIKNKGHLEPIKFSTETLKKQCVDSNYRLNDKEFIITMKNLFYKFFRANFKILIRDEERDMYGEKFINLFKEVTFWYPDDEEKILKEIELKVNPTFSYIVNELEREYTGFLLEEFINISGKYTKTLYRQLKQFRTTGKVYFKWEYFLKIMDIPEKKQIGEIERDILKPAIKELTRERHLFDQIRTPFKNLTYEKKKQKGTRGRGGKVIGITFTFKPESITMQKLEKKTLMDKENEKNKHLQMLMQMRQFKYKFRYENYLHFITGYDYQKYKISTWKYTNTLADDEAITQEYTVNNEKEYFQLIKTFFNNIELD